MIDTAPLIAEITAAFDGVAREGGVSLREGRVLDDFGTEEQCAAARLLDTDTRWQDVSDADLEEYESSLSFFDAIGFRYYLPAYMLRDLRLNINPTYGMSSDIVIPLDPCVGTNLHDYSLDQFRLLTPQQGRAVCRFLRFVAMHGNEGEREDAVRVLRDYWNQYCDGDSE